MKMDRDTAINFVSETLARFVWCLLVAGFLWTIAAIFDPSVTSGDLWLISACVGLITYQMPTNS